MQSRRNLETELVRERGGHQRRKYWAARLGVAVLVILLAVTVLVDWWLIAKRCGSNRGLEG